VIVRDVAKPPPFGHRADSGSSYLNSATPKFEKNELRYGSGQLLTDFLTFSSLNKSQRKIIFLGDPHW